MYHKRILLMMAFAMAVQPAAAPMPVFLPKKAPQPRVPQTLARQNPMRQAQVRSQRPERRYA